MANSPIVTVVLPTYNRAQLLNRAIESVRRQTMTDWELIVVDDGSIDDTERVVRLIDDPRISYVRHEVNLGGPAARNTGIQRARGEYVAYFDSDNQWHPEKLARQLDVFAGSELRHLAVVTCGMQLIQPNRTSDHIPCKRGWVFDDVLRRRVGVYDTNTMLVRRRGMPEFLFDPRLPALQDLDLLARITRDYQLDYTTAVLVKNRYDDPVPRVSDRNLDGRLAFMEKYAAELQARPETLSHHHVRLAFAYYYQGHMAFARRHLLQAARSFPARLQHWAWLTAASLGPSALWFAQRAFRHETLR